MPSIDTLCIRIFANGRIPGARHERTLHPQEVACKWDVEKKSGIITLSTAAEWRTPESTMLGPEKILWQNLHGKKILASDRFPEIVFAGEWDGEQAISGILTLRGTTKSVQGTCHVRHEGDQAILAGTLPIHLPDWGIKRFKALFGTIWVLDDAEIEFSIRGSATSV